MTASSMTTFASLLKERYYDSSDILQKLVYPDNPFLGMLKKKGDTGMVGRVLPVPLFLKNPQGVGGAFATAQTNASPTGSDEFNIECGKYFGVVHIDDMAIMASRTNSGAFLEHKKIEIDGLYETLGEMLSLHAWSNGGGALGRISTLSGDDIVLDKPEQTANFERDMTVVASDNDGSVSTHALRDSGDGTTVSTINRATGAITLASAAAIAALAAGDYLFRQSDFFGDTGTIILKGLQCFLTATDSPMALWGITAATRAADPQRYAGYRVRSADVMGKQMDERIKILLAQMTTRGKATKAPTHGFLHPEDFQVLDTLMAGTGQRSLPDSSTSFGYRKIDINTPTAKGTTPIFLDRHCPKGTFFALNMDNWWISSMGELLHPQTSDGNEILRRASATDLEFRVISYPLLVNNAPINNGRVPIT